MTDASPDASPDAPGNFQPDEGRTEGTARDANEGAAAGIRELWLFLRLVQAHAQLRWNFCAFLFAAGLLGPLSLTVLLLASEEAALSRSLVWWILPSLTALFLLAGPVTSKIRFRSLENLARLVSPRMPTPELRAGFLPAVELSEALTAAGGSADRSSAGPGKFSEGLALAHVADTARRLREVEPGSLVKKGAVARAFKFAFGAFFLSLGVGFFTADRLESGVRFIVRPPEEAAAALAAPQQAEEPVTGDIRLTLTPPAYARRETTVIEGSGGEIFALKGTEAGIQTRADRLVSEASVILDSGTEVPFRVAEDGRSLTGSLTVTEAGRYRFHLVPADGSAPVEGPRIPVTLEQDAPPAIELTEPLADVEAESGETVRLSFEASDDFGIREAALFYRLPGAPSPRRVVIDRPEGAPKSLSGGYDFDLTALGLMSGDEVVFYLEALDNDVMDGPKASVTPTRVIKIYSRAEHHRQLMERLAAEWEKLIVLLGDRLESPELRKKASAVREGAVRGRALDAKFLDLARSLSALANEAGEDEAPAQLRSAIGNAGESLERNVRRTMRARDILLSTHQAVRAAENASRQQAFARALAEEIAGTEHTILYLETLLDEQRTLDLKENAAELRAKQRQLSGLLEELRTSPDDETRARVFEEIARLKERMADLMKRMGQLSRSIQDAHVNAEAMRELSEAGAAMDAFDRMQEKLARGEIEEAAKALDEIGQVLETLERQLEGAADELGSDVDRGLGDALAQFAGDLDALSEAQSGLLNETRKLHEAEARRRDETLAAQGDDFWSGLQEKVRSARENLDGIRLSDGYFGSETLRRAKEKADELALALEVKSFERAAGFSAEAADGMELLNRELERQRRFFSWGASAAALQRHADNGNRSEEAARKIGEVKKALESLSEELSSGSMDAAAEQAMKRLAEKEAALSGKAEELKKRMDDLNQSAPLFPEEARQLLKDAAQQMAEAESGLQEAQTSRAARSQQAALEQLSALKKGLGGGEEGQPSGGSERGQPGGAKQGGMKGMEASSSGSGTRPRRIPWPWGTSRMDSMRMQDGRTGNAHQQNSSEKVRLPQAENYEAPEAYRRDILDAMKERAPERYREDIRRYYEEIIR